MIDWRALLTSIGTEWIDRGPNTSRGNININCPFCAGADPSYHLAISETTGQYFCFRGRRAHSGNAPERLLIELGIPRSDAFRLMRDFDSMEQYEITREVPADLIEDWNRFKNVRDIPAACQYLATRGFNSWSLDAKRYDIRYSSHGPYKGRVLFPIRYNGVLSAWSGRSIYDKTPLYKMNDGGQEGHIYIPLSLPVMVVCEGPIDALKCVTSAVNMMSVGAVALLGSDIGPARLVRLREALRSARTILVCPDADVDVSVRRAMTAEISTVLRDGQERDIRRVWPPTRCKDIGGAEPGEVRKWLSRLI